MTDIDTLAALLERLNEDEDTAEAEREARELLAAIDPTELALAEQKLVEAGLSMDDLKGFCQIHMDLLRDELHDLRQSLPAGHVLHTLMCEHDAILGFLDELEGVNRAVQRMDRYDAGCEELAKLSHIAEHLIETELHHQREEEALFPEIESRGLTAPPEMMRTEHEDLRARKRRLGELAIAAATMDFAAFKQQLSETAGYIVEHLRDHIFKENNILYPAALKILADPDTWDRIKAHCDEIGYCCFTPKT